jgi:hypothetical protein
VTLTTKDVLGRIYAYVFQDDDVIDENAPFTYMDSVDTSDQSLEMRLPRGVYFIRVLPRANDWPQNLYTLTLRAEEYQTIETPTDPGGDKDEAENLGAHSASPIVVGGYVGTLDEEDYYAFQLADAATVTVTTQDVLGRVYAYVYENADVIVEGTPAYYLDRLTPTSSPSLWSCPPARIFFASFRGRTTGRRTSTR